MVKKHIFGLIIVALMAWSVEAASYFVDFSGGSDAAAGTAQGTAWKHCPGDANATGVAAATMPAAGDTVFFKGGSIYQGAVQVNNYGGSSLASPVTFMSAEATWGSGRAVFDCYHDGITNSHAFLIGFSAPFGGAYCTISGFELRNIFTAGVQTESAGTIVTNCIIHHVGEWPNDGINYNSHGFGFLWDNGSGAICVSNAMYDLNETAFYINGGHGASGGGILWGNTISNVQDHALIGVPANGYQLIAFNSIHDQTNGLSHDDNIHTQGFYPGNGAMIFCGNKLWNGNQDFFVNTLVNSGDCYFFDNVLDQTAMDANWQNGYANGIVINVNQAQGWSNLCIFGNTIIAKNTGSGGMRIANRQVAPFASGTNFLFVNNLMYQSYYSGKPDPTNVIYFFSGYNANTNFILGNAIPSSDVNSVYGNILFANLIKTDPQASDLHLATGSVGIGQGTNLSATFPANFFAFLPTRYRVDPTVDAAGQTRGSTWDIGAFQGASTPPGQSIAHVTNFHANKAFINPH